MPDAVGKLDGLRDIVHPPAPVIADYSVLLTVLACLSAVVFLVYLYKRLQNRRLARARRSFYRLKQNSSTWDSSRCGDTVISILRLYTGTHNVQIQTFSAQTIPGFDIREWSTLIQDCNRLRFSTEPLEKEILLGVINKIETILWPRR